MTQPPEFILENEDGPIKFSREFALLDPYNGPDAKPGQYILQEEFWTQWENFGTVYRIRIPKGYITDIASIPRWVWSWSGLIPDGLYRNAAVGEHDPGYMWQGKFPPGWFQKLVNGQWVNVPDKWSKDQIDRLFLRIMKACGVDKDTRTKMYWAVRIFGWWAWWRVDKTRERYRNAFV